MSWWRWLAPGLRVKRWLALAGAGLVMLSVGLALALDRPVAVALEGIADLTGQWLPAGAGGAVLLLAGGGLLIAGGRGAYRSLSAALTPYAPQGLGELIVRRRQAVRGPRVVAVGGGTGLATLARGLKQYTSNITAIVTVTDDGGSSGRLVGELGVLPPGDIRNVLIALADMEPLMEQLLQHRFRRGSLAGHAFGNLFIGALTEILGDFELAVRESSKVLAVRGRVLPSTVQQVRLCATLEAGTTVAGESAIAEAPGRISSVYLDPPDVQPLRAAQRALAEADVIMLGPGSLYTSILPNLLIPDLAASVRESRALKVFVANVMTQPGETDGYTAADHTRALLQHAGAGSVDYVLVNTGRARADRLRRYEGEGAEPVLADLSAIARLGPQAVTADVVSRGDLVRHDPQRLAVALLRLLLDHGPPRARRFFRDLWLSERLRRAPAAAGVPSRPGGHAHT